jgi:hypothetical protein
VVVIVLASVSACGPTGPSSDSPIPSDTPAGTDPPTTETIVPSPTDEPATSPAAGGILVDPSLLDLLPTTVSGVPLTPDAETAADLAADRALAETVEAIALAAAFGPPSTDAIGDYAVVTVARLHPGVFDDSFFRGWRDSFDEAVCAQAGGVDSGSSELDIEGHQTYRRGCVGGVVTYHTYLADRNVIVSLQGIGPAELGRRVVEGLTE